MNNNKVAISYNNKSFYPDRQLNPTVRPSVSYPEYPFKQDLSKEENPVYDMVRECLHLLKLDEKNYGTPSWNPLGSYIKPQDYVVLKPNLVMHKNYLGGGYSEDIDCVYTNISITAALIDYVIVALKGTGTIVVGDAPVQECDFNDLVEKSGYKEVIEYYKRKGINICLKDFRGLISKSDYGVLHQTVNESSKGIVVHLDNESEFCTCTENQLSNLRLTNYEPSELLSHHHDNFHEYFVAEDILKADCVINIPKPKTHRKAGVTAALKNLVGMNCRKEYLPHHTIGTKTTGGDEYNKDSKIKKIRTMLHDKFCINVAQKKYFLARCCQAMILVLDKIVSSFFKDKTSFGSWSGNNTISKTTTDLNKIIIFADKNGKMQNTPQRKIFSVGDMIISGEHNGPMAPSSKHVGMVVAAENSVCFDEVVAIIMGAILEKIPTLQNARNCSGKIKIVDNECTPVIASNCEEYDGKTLADIDENSILYFQSPDDWEECYRKK